MLTRYGKLSGAVLEAQQLSHCFLRGLMISSRHTCGEYTKGAHSEKLWLHVLVFGLLELS